MKRHRSRIEPKLNKVVKKRKIESSSIFNTALNWLQSWIFTPPEDLLFSAATEGNLVRVNELIAQGVELSTSDAELAADKLRGAIRDHKMDIAEALIAAGTNKEVLYYGMTSLHYAIQKGQSEIVQALLRSGANKEALYRGMTPLHHATKKGQTEIFKALLMAGANKKALHKSMTLLHYAIKKGQTEIVYSLLTSGANKAVLYQDMTPLHHAIVKGKVAIVEYLLAANAKKSLYKGMSPLHLAIKHNQTKIVQALIDARANKEALYESMTPLNYAIQQEVSPEIIQALLSAGANKEALYKSMTPLHWAIEDGNTEIVKVLLCAGANKEALYKSMPPLHWAIEDGNTEIVKVLLCAGANKEALYESMTPLHYAIEKEKNEIVQMLIDAGANKEVPFPILQKVNDPKLIETLLPHCLFEGLPLYKALSNSNYFNSHKRRSAFLNCEFPLEFLESKNLLSTVNFAALQLLSTAREVEEYEAELISDDENAMDDSKVTRAHWHFKNKVKPHFKSAMAAYATSSEVKPMEPILVIEKQIRELLLNTIFKQAQADNEQNVIEFINKNRENLIQAESDAMQASIAVFTKAHPAHAAWRGYNPYAPVRGEWENLLTPPADNTAVFSTKAAHEGELLAQTASDILRKRVAYYYLAVMDVNDGDDDTRASRIENFISQLADIRNAHGLDDPSCYPGSLTRCADMGAFHTVAQLPPTTKEMIADFIRVKVLAAFQVEMQTLKTFSEKEMLYQALVELTALQAKSVIFYPERYQADWLELRQNFISKMGTIEGNLVQIFEADLFPITEDESIFIEQALIDIAGGTTNAALTDYFYRHTDVVPSVADKQNANPFMDDDSTEHQLTDILLNIILQTVPVYATSTRKLNNLSGYLANKVPELIKGASLKSLLAGLEIADEHFDKVLSVINSALEKSSWKAPVIIVNPFDGKIKQIELLIKNLPPERAKPYCYQLESFRKKQQHFNDCFPVVQQVFQNVDIQDECLVRLTEALASHLASSDKGFERAEFSDFLNDTDKLLMQEHSKQLDFLAIQLHKDRNTFSQSRM